MARGELSARAAARPRRRAGARSPSRWLPASAPRSVGLLALFLALQAAYTLSLRNVVLLDVMAISGLFVIRAAAGAEAVDVRISPWLLLCTALLALFLALAKRRGELVLAGSRAAPGRSVLSGYSLALVDQLITIVAAATVVAYSLYTFGSEHSPAMADDPLRRLRPLPLPAARAPGRPRRGARADPALGSPDPGRRRAVGADGRGDPRLGVRACA